MGSNVDAAKARVEQAKRIVESQKKHETKTVELDKLVPYDKNPNVLWPRQRKIWLAPKRPLKSNSTSAQSKSAFPQWSGRAL